MTYEENVARLEAIVAELEGDGVTLDAALRLFEEGVERLRAASEQLATAEARVQVLVDGAGGAVEGRPFNV